MAQPDSNDSSSSAASALPDRAGELDCPLRRVLAANQHGLVVESVRGFEVGSSMVLGCHVETPAGNQGAEAGARGSVFVSAETIVVESQQRTPSVARRRLPASDSSDAVASADTVYQVTLMFSDISGYDRELLVNLTSVDGIRLASGQVARRSGLAIPPPQVLPIGDHGGDGLSLDGGPGGSSGKTVAPSAGAADLDSATGAAGSCSLN